MAFKQPPAASGWPPWTLLASEPDIESTLKHCQTDLTILLSLHGWPPSNVPTIFHSIVEPKLSKRKEGWGGRVRERAQDTFGHCKECHYLEKIEFQVQSKQKKLNNVLIISVIAQQHCPDG